MPITVWGNLAKEKPTVGDTLLVCNAKQAAYHDIPRFSVGDSGSVTMLPSEMESVQELVAFNTAQVNADFELPDGVQVWSGEEDDTSNSSSDEANSEL
jgi:hypothetical protein